MKIRVKTLNLKDQELEIDDDATLGALRKMIEEKMGILETRQRLIFQGHPLLCNERPLKDYGIADGLTLHMVERPADALTPPGLNSQRCEHGHGGGNEHVERTRVNVINGEMAIIRNSVFEDAGTTAELVREALSNVLNSVLDSTSTEVETQENIPRNGDMTLRVHIRGAAVRHIDSGAFSRINFISDGLRRSERTLQLLEREPFLSMTVDGYERVMPPLRSDFERAKFGETVLELEELLHISRAELADEPEGGMTVGEEGGGSQTTDNPTNDSPRQNTILRNSTPENYVELLRRILAVQNLANNHIRRYQEMIRKRSNMPNNRAKCIALCYEENFRRVLHRLSHAYHSISDIAVNFSAPASPLEPSAAENNDEPIAEVVLTLVFVGQNEQNARAEGRPTSGESQRPASAANQQQQPADDESQQQPGGDGNQQPTSDNTNQMHRNTGYSRAYRGLRTLPILDPVTRRPTVLTFPSFNTPENRMSSPGLRGPPIYVPTARLHVSPGPESVAHEEPSGTSGSNANQTEAQNTNNHSASSDSAGNNGGPMNAAVRGGIQSFLRNILPNAFGNMMPVQPGQTASGTGTGANARRSRNPLLEMHNYYHHGAAPPSVIQPSVPTFRAPYGPGIVGQVIVRTNGPANAEAARRALDAAMQAATAAVGENGVHVQVNGMPRVGPPMVRNRGNIVWARRTYTSRGNRGGVLEHPTDMFIGPNYPSDSTIYTNDPHLNCQSSFYNPRTNIHNSTAYETLINDLYQATLRYKAGLGPESSEAADVESLINRWDRVRGLNEADSHVALNQRGEALFECPEHFKNILMTMLRRAVANLASADAGIAHRLSASQGEYEIFNYGMVPVVSTPLHGFDIPGPPVGSIELDTVDIEAFDTSQETTLRDDSMGEDTAANQTDATQESMSSETQASSVAGEESGENDVDIVEMVRTLSNLMQSGRSTTLAQVMREMGQPVTHLNSGFVNLVMVLAYEILQIPELVQILNGNFSSLSKNRQQIRRFLIDNVFNDNSRPSDEDIKNAAERVALAESELDRFLAYVDVHRYADVAGVGRIDIAASVLRLEKRVVEEFLRHLMRTDDDLTPEEYSKTIVDMFAAYVYRAVVLANLSMTNQPYDYEALLLRFMERPSGVDERHLLNFMAQMSMSHIRLLLRRETPFTVRDMMEDIVLASGSDEAVESNNLPSNSEVGDAVEPPAAVCVESEMEKNGGENEKKPEDVEMRETSEAVAGGSWKCALPADWVPVIEDDRNRSVARRVKSFSEAYLSGGCSVKRKGMKVAAEGTYDAVVSSAVRRSLEEAVSSSGYSVPDVPNVEEASELLQNDFDDQLRVRIAHDANFDPEKYPELDKFMKKGNS